VCNKSCNCRLETSFCVIYIHCVSKKFSPFNCLQFCQILTDFDNFCTAGKHMKFATKPGWHYPPHLRHVATLPWEIKTSNCLQMLKKKQTNCILIASIFVIHPQILIFSVFKIANLSPYWLQIKFSMSLSFCLLTLVINLWHRKFVTANVTAVFVKNQHDIKRRGQDFNKKSLYLKGYTAKRLTDEFP